MKHLKILSAVLCISMAFTLSACGSGEQSGLSDDGGVTYLSRVNELMSNVENVPLAGDISGTSSSSETAAASARVYGGGNNVIALSSAVYADDYVDLTSAEDNANYQRYLLHREGSDQYDTAIDNGDLLVEQMKKAVKEALEKVIQLDVWVQDANWLESSSQWEGARYKLGYNEVTDVASIEYLSLNEAFYGSQRYFNLTSGYNESGNLQISGYLLEHFVNGSSEPNRTVSFYYEENVEYRQLCIYESDEPIWQDYNYLLSCNLAGGANEFYFMSGGNVARLIKAKDYIEIERLGESEYIYTLRNENSEYVGEWNYLSDIPDVRLSLDLYELEGWDSFYYKNGYFYLESDGEVIADSTIFDGGISSDGYIYSADNDYRYMICVDYALDDDSHMPQLYIIISDITAGMTFYDALCEILENIGIRSKYSVVYDQLAYMDAPEQAFDFTAFGLDSSFVPSTEKFNELAALNLADTISYESALALYDAEYVTMDEQVEDKRYYQIFDFDITGSASFDSTSGTLSLTDISATLSSVGALGVEGGEYAVIVVATDGITAAEIARTTATYSGGVTVNGGTISADELIQKITFGDYTLKYYVARVSSGGDVKLSSLYDISADGTFAAEGEGYKLTVICGEKTVISYEQITEESDG